MNLTVIVVTMVALCVGYIIGLCMSGNNNKRDFVKRTRCDNMNDNEKMEGGAPTHQVGSDGLIIPQHYYRVITGNNVCNYPFVCNAVPHYSHVEFYGWISDDILFTKCGVMGERIPSSYMRVSDQYIETKFHSLLLSEYNSRIVQTHWDHNLVFHYTATISIPCVDPNKTKANGWLLTVYEQIGHIIAAYVVMKATGCTKFSAWSHTSYKTLLNATNGKRLTKGDKQNVITNTVRSTMASECFAAVCDNGIIQKFTLGCLSYDLSMCVGILFCTIMKWITSVMISNEVPINMQVYYNTTCGSIPFDPSQQTFESSCWAGEILNIITTSNTNDMLNYMANWIGKCIQHNGQTDDPIIEYNFSNNGACNSVRVSYKFVNKKGFPINITYGFNADTIFDLFIAHGIIEENGKFKSNILLQEWGINSEVLTQYANDLNNTAISRLFSLILLCNMTPAPDKHDSDCMMSESYNFMQHINVHIQNIDTVEFAVAIFIVIMNYIRYSNILGIASQKHHTELNNILMPSGILHGLIVSIASNRMYLFNSLYCVTDLINDTIIAISNNPDPNIRNIHDCLVQLHTLVNSELEIDLADNGF